MPDRNEQNWTPDEAFWNEAWTDMNGRLARRKRRRFLPFLWLLLPALLAGSLVLWNQPTELAAPTQSSAIPQASIVEEKPEKASSVAPVSDLLDQGDPAPSPSTSLYETPSTVPGATTGERIAPALSAPGVTTEKTSPREAYLAVTEIPTLGPQFLDVPLLLPRIGLLLATPEIECPPVRTFTVTLGTNLHTQSWKPGGFAEIGYRIGGGKWSIPVGIRYRYARRSFTIAESLYENALEDMFTSGSAQPPANFSSSSLRAAFAESGFDVIRSHEIELRGGLGRSFGSCGKLYLSGGAGIGYLVSGEGPVLYSRSDGSATMFAVAEERFGSSSMLDASNVAPNAGYNPVITTVNRFNTSVWLRGDLLLGKRYGLTVGVSRYFSQFYRDGVIDVERTRLELGLSRRL
ncbi:hypothetical protein GGR28_000891 [Lewinella aquimaris]|uniref:Uncharacterized protein n=1 Tax=Neolewinella aquimaris TaxID=1835722 RepID=A0A840DZF5_9BACT|nr:hypothetical protein [Neolewinella aquimaris]MBB4078290.1 hypothetical protein [Neolewinella aquimaris]